MILGVAGPNAAGKGEVVRLLSEKGFSVLSLSDVIRETLLEQGLAESRERMIELGTRLRAEGGNGVLADRILAGLQPGHDYAIDSIRHPEEVAVLSAGTQPFLLLWVDASVETRFARLLERGRSGDPSTLERFQELEARELASDASSGQQLLGVRGMADRFLNNDGGLAHLQLQLDAVLEGESPGQTRD